MVLTVYSNDFDHDTNVSNNGFSGKTFIESCPGAKGQEFKSVQDALSWCVSFGVTEIELHFMFRDIDGDQSFKKFDLHAIG